MNTGTSSWKSLIARHCKKIKIVQKSPNNDVPILMIQTKYMFHHNADASYYTADSKLGDIDHLDTKFDNPIVQPITHCYG